MALVEVEGPDQRGYCPPFLLVVGVSLSNVPQFRVSPKTGDQLLHNVVAIFIYVLE